jgi:hypothetical protein
MRLFPVILCFSAALLWSNHSLASEAGKTRIEYPARYEGGTLPLSHDKVKATLGKEEVVFAQNRHRIVVPLKHITNISCGSEVRRRLGAAVLDIVPRVRLGEVQSHYIGVSWMDSTQTSGRPGKVELLLKLDKADYENFLTALERSTGVKAVDTTHVPTAVRYAL